MSSFPEFDAACERATVALDNFMAGKPVKGAQVDDLIVSVEVWEGNRRLRAYTMNHDDPTQRRVLGEQCRNAFEGGQRIVTFPAYGARQ